jgi:hypothetical protein
MLPLSCHMPLSSITRAHRTGKWVGLAELDALWDAEEVDMEKRPGQQNLWESLGAFEPEVDRRGAPARALTLALVRALHHVRLLEALNFSAEELAPQGEPQSESDGQESTEAEEEQYE